MNLLQRDGWACNDEPWRFYTIGFDGRLGGRPARHGGAIVPEVILLHKRAPHPWHMRCSPVFA